MTAPITERAGHRLPQRLSRPTGPSAWSRNAGSSGATSPPSGATRASAFLDQDLPALDLGQITPASLSQEPVCRIPEPRSVPQAPRRWHSAGGHRQKLLPLQFAENRAAVLAAELAEEIFARIEAKEVAEELVAGMLAEFEVARADERPVSPDGKKRRGPQLRTTTTNRKLKRK